MGKNIEDDDRHAGDLTRREFVRTTAVVASAGALIGPTWAYARGDDIIRLEQISGVTTVLGGPGADTLIVRDNGDASGSALTLDSFGADIFFDGDGHQDEDLLRVGSLSEIGFDENTDFPSVFVGTGSPTE